MKWDWNDTKAVLILGAIASFLALCVWLWYG